MPSFIAVIYSKNRLQVNVARTALEQHLGAGGRRRLDAAASGRSGQSDISERIEEILASEIAPSR